MLPAMGIKVEYYSHNYITVNSDFLVLWIQLVIAYKANVVSFGGGGLQGPPAHPHHPT